MTEYDQRSPEVDIPGWPSGEGVAPPKVIPEVDLLRDYDDPPKPPFSPAYSPEIVAEPGRGEAPEPAGSIKFDDQPTSPENRGTDVTPEPAGVAEDFRDNPPVTEKSPEPAVSIQFEDEAPKEPAPERADTATEQTLGATVLDDTASYAEPVADKVSEPRAIDATEELPTPSSAVETPPDTKETYERIPEPLVDNRAEEVAVVPDGAEPVDTAPVVDAPPPAPETVEAPSPAPEPPPQPEPDDVIDAELGEFGHYNQKGVWVRDDGREPVGVTSAEWDARQAIKDKEAAALREAVAERLRKMEGSGEPPGPAAEPEDVFFFSDGGDTMRPSPNDAVPEPDAPPVPPSTGWGEYVAAAAPPPPATPREAPQPASEQQYERPSDIPRIPRPEGTDTPGNNPDLPAETDVPAEGIPEQPQPVRERAGSGYTAPDELPAYDLRRGLKPPTTREQMMEVFRNSAGVAGDTAKKGIGLAVASVISPIAALFFKYKVEGVIPIAAGRFRLVATHGIKRIAIEVAAPNATVAAKMITSRLHFGTRVRAAWKGLN
jgi:hypothetical protein